MKYHSVLSVLALVVVHGSLQAADPDLRKIPPASDKKGLTYAKDIRPIFESSCFRCHGEERQKGELRLDTLQAVMKGGEDGKVVIPGQSLKSLLLLAVARVDEEKAMPPKPKPGGFRGGPGGPGGAGRPPGPPPGAPGERPRGGPGGGPGGMGPPSKPLTAEQVGLIRAWIDQGAK